MTTKQLCKNCTNGDLKPMHGIVGSEAFAGYLLCHGCGAVYAGQVAYKDNILFGIYKQPKGAITIGDALVCSPDGKFTTPRLEWCDKTITVEGKLLNCILDHSGDGRMHQARAVLNGAWVEVTWDLGNKKKESQ